MATSIDVELPGDPCDEFRRSMQSGIFTFFVGSEKAKFEVHNRFVSKASVVLDRMMNGKMKESIEQRAELLSVDSDVFASFTRFCYSGDYILAGRIETDAVLTELLPHRHNLSNFGLHVLSAHHYDDFNCARCGTSMRLTSKNTAFPYCSIIHAKDGQTKPFYCIVCGEQENSGIGGVCQQCLEPNPGMLSAVISEDEPDFWAAFENANKLAVLRDAVEGNATFKGVPIPCFGPLIFVSGNLLGHAKIYVFADVYECPKLKALSMAKLCREMSRYAVTTASISKIIDLVEYTYQNTRAGSDLTNIDVLRQLVVTFLAMHTQVLMSSVEARAFFGKGGEITIDLMQAMASRKWS